MTNERILRHPNGGAAKIGMGVHVSADSFCDKATEIGGRSSVIQSTVKNAIVACAQIFESAIENTWLNTSVCSKSALRGVFAEDCILDRVAVNSSHLLRLEGVVAETCELHGNWTLSGNARIHEGQWHRAPRFRRITGDNGVDFGLTECKAGYAMLGCWCKPLTELLKAGPRLGRKHGWSREQIETARQFYQRLLDEPLEM